MGLSVRTPKYRYTRWVPYCRKKTLPCRWDYSNPAELYDHDCDPEENYNVVDEKQYARDVASLDALLNAKHSLNTEKEWKDYVSQSVNK